MHRERLKILEAELRKPMPKGATFNMGVWLREYPCGTVCCAAGLASTIPTLQKQGLSNNGHIIVYHIFTNAIDVLKRFFDLDESEVAWLFFPSSYNNVVLPGEISQDMVADRIRELLLL